MSYGQIVSDETKRQLKEAISKVRLAAQSCANNQDVESIVDEWLEDALKRLELVDKELNY